MILNVLTTIRPNHHHLGSSLASFLMVFSVKTTVYLYKSVVPYSSALTIF